MPAFFRDVHNRLFMDKKFCENYTKIMRRSFCCTFIFLVYLIFLPSIAFSEPFGSKEGREPPPDRAGNERMGDRDAPDKNQGSFPPPSSDKADLSDMSLLYHGKRICTVHEPFCVVCIQPSKTALRIIFNIPIDPRTFVPQNILINGHPLSPDAVIKFNRTGKLMECKVKLGKNDVISLTLKDVKSFDGEVLKRVFFQNLRVGQKIHY